MSEICLPTNVKCHQINLIAKSNNAVHTSFSSTSKRHFISTGRTPSLYIESLISLDVLFLVFINPHIHTRPPPPPAPSPPYTHTTSYCQSLMKCNESNETVCFICKNFLLLYVVVNYIKRIKSANKPLFAQKEITSQTD